MTKTKETDFEQPPRGHVAILYYDVTNDRFQVAQGDDVDTAIPAAARALLASSLAHGYDGTLWRKLPLLWGYTDRYAESARELMVDAGAWVWDSTAVPPGEVWKVEFAYGRNETAGVTTSQVQMLTGGVLYTLAYKASMTQWESIIFNGQLTLKEGDQVRLRLSGCADGEQMDGGVWGYKMTIDM